MSAKLAPLDTSAVSARASLTSAQKAVLAMASTEYLARTSSNDADNVRSPICSPLSATSTFSSLWSPTSRRCSAASDTSQHTDHSDECANSTGKGNNPWMKQAVDQAGAGVVLETPEVLAVGACVVCEDPATSNPGIVLVRERPSKHATENQNHGHLSQQSYASGLWRLPQSTTIADDMSISEALARTVKWQTGLNVSRVAATLHDTRHHLHHEQDIQFSSLRTLKQNSKLETTQRAKDCGQPPRTRLGPETLDELMRMIDPSCAGAAASFAAAAAARRNRNMPTSSGVDCCHICDFTSSDLNYPPEAPTRQYSRRNFVGRVRRDSSYDDEISDSCSSASSSGYASNSDESTCHLLHGEEYTDGETDEDDEDVKIDIATSGTNRKSLQQRMASVRNSEPTNKYTKPYSGFSYTALRQDTGDDANGFSQAAAATLDSDTESDDSIVEHDLYFSEDDDDSVIEPSQHFRKCLQLNYIVFVSDDPKKVAATKITTCFSQVVSAETGTETEMETALVTELDIDEWRMSPQTRDLVKQGLWWAKDYFPAPAGKLSKSYT